MTEGATPNGTAVLVMAYGGPDCLEAVGPFMHSLMGRVPTPEMLGRVQDRYALIGGCSPLPAIARRFASQLGAQLDAEGTSVPVVVGFKYTAPLIGDVLCDLHASGVRTVVAVSLSPFESKSTSTAYEAAVEVSVADLEGMQVVFTPPFHSIDAFVDAHSCALQDALSRLDADSDRTLTVFTAHSLPVDELETPERYVSGLREVASRIANEVGGQPGQDFEVSSALEGISSFGSLQSPHPWLLAYQSKGMRGGEWLGPDLGDVMEAAALAGYRAIAVSPIGFATEHMETRYDLDVVEARRAEDLGLRFERGMAPNDDPALVAAVAQSVRHAIERGL